jgi:hypothetical protein
MKKLIAILFVVGAVSALAQNVFVSNDATHPIPITSVAGGTATGSAVPASAAYEGLNVAGILRGITGVNPSGVIYAQQIDVSSVAGTTAVTSASGVLKVGVVGSAGGAMDATTGAAVPSNAIYNGSRAATANPTNATGGNLVGVMADKAGRLVVTEGHVRELVAMQTTTISASTSETTIVTAGGASVFADISQISITTTNAAAATLTLKDATAGTTQAVWNYPSAAANPNVPLVLNFPIPMKQTTANNNWTLTASVNAGNFIVNVVYVKNL